MGCAISSVLKLVIQIINVVLAIAFLILALLGILLKTSQPFIKSILLDLTDEDDLDLDEYYAVQFILDNSTSIAVVLIVGGLILAALCIVGCVSSCCGIGILLKIYALILIILFAAQIIAIAVIFSDRPKYTKWFIDKVADLAEFYGTSDEKNATAVGVWNFFMKYQINCCGMEGYQDFKGITGVNFPPQCCDNFKKCDKNEAQTKKVRGCRKKITNFTEASMLTVMYVWIGAILIQTALVILVGVAIWLD